MEKYYHNQEFLDIAKKMMSSLSEKYTTVDYLQSNGIIKDGMYSRKHGHKSECTSWGDYFYLEALMRMKKRLENLLVRRTNMKYGHFDDLNKEYVIDTPRTPLPWINYLGTNGFSH